MVSARRRGLGALLGYVAYLCLVSCGGATATPTTTPAPVPDLPFTIVGSVSRDTPERIRREVNVVIPDWSDRATVESTLIMLAEAMLDETGAGVVDVVIVFAWDDPELVSVAPFTVGRAQLSRDGRGWDGDGLYLHGHGEGDGSILLEVVTRRSGPHVQGIEPLKMPHR